MKAINAKDEGQNPASSHVQVVYKDFNADLKYSPEVLQFFRKKLDEFTINIFIQAVRENKEHRGLVKTRLPNYHSMRKKYDAAFLILEYQGFLEKKEDGTATPYYVTIRGLQLGKLIQVENKRKDEGGIND
ncbi:hypothetical protein [Peribacillus loiseleuriae]|uniref:hypothetical protein n=1 Tax=Peribacillus loiseleuriae TaxID=1679170 RepID=UPI003CFD87B3